MRDVGARSLGLYERFPVCLLLPLTLPATTTPGEHRSIDEAPMGAIGRARGPWGVANGSSNHSRLATPQPRTENVAPSGLLNQRLGGLVVSDGSAGQRAEVSKKNPGVEVD